jgi:hypothetical protein
LQSVAAAAVVGFVGESLSIIIVIIISQLLQSISELWLKNSAL